MRKTRKIIVISMLMLILISLLGKNTYAAMEVKAETSAKTSITVSNSFAYCYNLRASSSTLGNNTLDPHLTLNSDWGAVAYLAASVYGANSPGESASLSSTTGNESGVKDFGTNYTQTSSLYDGFAGYTVGVTTNLATNINTKYVEKLSTTDSVSTTRGQAFAETSSFASTSAYTNRTYIVAIRKYAFGYQTQYGGGGSGHEKVTFRPVIWN